MKITLAMVYLGYQDKLQLYPGFFEFVYNAKRRGKRLLSALL